MGKFPAKINTALINIDAALSSILLSKEKGCPIGSFVIYDTLFSFNGALSRAMIKNDYGNLTDLIRTTLRAYAYYMDNCSSVRWDILMGLIKDTRDLIFQIKRR